MKKFLNILIAVSAAMSLAACGSTPVTEGREEVDVSDLEGVPAEAGKDITAYLTDNALKSDTVLAEFDGITLTADELSLMLTDQYSSIYYYYMSYYNQEIDLQEEMADGTKLQDMIASYAAQNALAVSAAKAIAQKNGIELSEEQKDMTANLFETRAKEYGGNSWADYVSLGKIKEEEYTEEQKEKWITENGERVLRNYLLYLGTTKYGYKSIFEKDIWYSEATGKLFAEDGVYAPTDEDLERMTAEQIEENGIAWARCILFSTMAAQTEEEKEKIKETADTVYEALSGLSGQELSDAFTSYQSEYDESGYTPGEVQMYSSTDSLVDGYYDGILKLKPGEAGMTEETAYGWFILLREEDDSESMREQVIASYPTLKMQELVEEYLENSGIKAESLYEKIDLSSYFAKVKELQDAVAAAQNAELSAE